MCLAAMEGKGSRDSSGKWQEANRCRQLQTATQRGVMPNLPYFFVMERNVQKSQTTANLLHIGI